jgi:thymidylate synthase (FAD)
MKVTLVASTLLAGPGSGQLQSMSLGGRELPDSVAGTKFDVFHEMNAGSSADRLAHFAGRACYQAWNMPNPATSTDEGYLANILKQGHESVLEHSSASFYIEGVSRALLAELTRHRHLSFSVESQRYVDYSDTEPVIPPAFGEDEAQHLRMMYSRDLVAYESMVVALMREGLNRKQAREASRAFLPNAAPVAMVVTGNMRAFRDVLRKRYSIHADAEILELAKELLRQLREIAPASFQDYPKEPFE